MRSHATELKIELTERITGTTQANSGARAGTPEATFVMDSNTFIVYPLQ